MDETEAELDRERENGDRLQAALKLVLGMMRADELDDLRAVLITPRTCNLTVGHVLDGALALHESVCSARPQ
jgi:hypothetical protein